MVRAAVFAIFLTFAHSATAAPRPIIAAHRGVTAAGESENTIAAYRTAMAAGVEVIEIDLRRTADGELVVLHDARVDRTTGGSGAVSKMTLAQLKVLDAGGGQTIPTFREVLDLARGSGVRLLLDIKTGGRVEPREVIAMAEAQGALDRIIIGLRSAGEARVYRALAPTLPLLGLVRRPAEIHAMAAAGVGMIRLLRPWLFEAHAGCSGGAAPSCLVQRLQRRGLAVWVLADGAGHERRARAVFEHLVALRVDGILTDRPLLAAAAAD